VSSLTCDVTRDLSAGVLCDVPVLDSHVLALVGVCCNVADGVASWLRWDLEVLVYLDGAVLLEAGRAL
jgi:hypothetical protein